MANLLEIAESLAVNFEKENKKNSDQRPSGSKRRSWLIEPEDKNKASKNTHVTKAINPVYEPGLLPIIPVSDFKNINQNNLVTSLSQLRGNPLKVVKYIFQLSKNNSNTITRELTRCELTTSLDMSPESVRTALKFLIKNNLLTRVETKVGRLGWSKFKISDKLFVEIREEIEGIMKN